MDEETVKAEAWLAVRDSLDTFKCPITDKTNEDPR